MRGNIYTKNVRVPLKKLKKGDVKQKKVLITQSNYIPWKGYFNAIKRADVFVLYDDVQYTRRDWRNRNLIKTPQGLQWLTVPVVVKGKYLQTISETKISDRDWMERHWKAIQHNYVKAPFFDEYKFFFEKLYLNCSDLFLAKINLKFLKALCHLLEIETEFIVSSEFKFLEGDRSERLLNICRSLNATEYLSGPSAKDYLNTRIFEDSGIEVTWLDYSGYRPYPQLFGKFEHGVSIIDVIFNMGPESSRTFL
jgi:hypothetical protein